MFHISLSKISAKLLQFFQNHLRITLKVWFEHIKYNYIMCIPKRYRTTFSEYIVGGQRILQENIYKKQIHPSNWIKFHLLFLCRFLYSSVLCLVIGHLCPPKCPRDIKGTKKNKPLECLGHKRGTKLIFYSFVNYNANLCNPLIHNAIQSTLLKVLGNALFLSKYW